jgi:hypothetical protein
MKDVTTSPNEVLIFLLHHANVDRSNMIWQANALALNATMGDASVMWGYPANASVYPQSFPGCYLNDVISSYFSFDNLLGVVGPVTHFDVLDRTRPGQAPYVYSKM